MAYLRRCISDGLAAIVDGNKYVEFKLAKGKKIYRRINEIVNVADMGFIVVDSLSDRIRNGLLSKHSQMTIPEGFKVYIADISNGKTYLLEQNLKGRQLSAPLPLTGSALSISEKLSDLSQYMSDGSNVNARAACDFLF